MTAGTHTLLWRYAKDASLSSGSDAVWVDDIAIAGGISACTSAECQHSMFNGTSCTTCSLPNGTLCSNGTCQGGTCSSVVCGDGIVGGSEQCDLGAANGAANSCCSAACSFVAAGTTCRVAAGPCDVAETCSSSAPACPADSFVASGTVCRAAAGICDVAETCTGSTASCPADNFAASSTVCRVAAGPCDVAESCSGSAATCPADVTNCTGGNDAGTDGGSDAGACRCSGDDANGPVTVSCRQSACGSDYITYSCTANGWLWTGQTCAGNSDAGAGTCQCSGTGPGGVPVTVNCGLSACGSDYFSYSCSASGWSWTGQGCSGVNSANTIQVFAPVGDATSSMP